MYFLLVIFLFFMFLLAVSQPKFVKVSNPFRPPVVSWKMCIVYSLVFTGIIALFYYFAWPILRQKLGFKTKETAVTQSASGSASASASGERSGLGSGLGSSTPDERLSSALSGENTSKQKNEKDHLKNHTLASFRV
jgi:hypothetical protein